MTRGLGFRRAMLLLLAGLFGILVWSEVAAAPSRIFWRPDGQNLGDPSIPAYMGSSPVVAMIRYQGGVLAAFSNAGNGYRIHWSPDGENLGAGEIRYDGSSPVTAMIEYQGGVLVAFSNAGGNGNQILFSPDGYNLGSGELRYDGSSPVTALAEYNGGVMAAFSNAGGAGFRIWYSPNGMGLGAGSRLYDGSSPVVAMLPYQGGLLTAFSNAGNGYRIHWSPDGVSPGGGPVVYDGSSPVTAMAEYNGGVLTAFSKTGLGHRVHWSPDGNSIGTGDPLYDGSTAVSAILSYNGGVFTAFVGEAEGRNCRFLCGVARVISQGPESLRQVGRDIDRIRVKFQNEITGQLAGPALAAWLKESRNSSYSTALPVPPQVRKAMRGWFSDEVLDLVRFKAGDGGALNLANDIISFGEAEAVTLIDVIVFKGASEAGQTGLWAHELKHVEQFYEMGVTDFAKRYVKSRGKDLEDPAYAKQKEFIGATQ